MKKLNTMFAPAPKVETTHCRYCRKLLARDKPFPHNYCTITCLENFSNLLDEKVKLQQKLKDLQRGKDFLDAKETGLAMRIISDIEEIDNFRNSAEIRPK